jgi:S-sulfo-L-cysteine synthase (3-phospho-L-serine-dependent)
MNSSDSARASTVIHTSEKRAYNSVVEATELPRIIRLSGNLFAAAFRLMKLLPARHMIDKAEEAELLRPGGTVIETSSGTLALGLAIVCRLRDYELIIVGDPAIDRNLRAQLELLGASVELVDNADQPGGIQRARLVRVEELRADIPNSYVPGQYDNPENPAAYAPVADLICDALGGVDCLVGTVGSGGSTGGIAKAIRQRQGDVRLVGVDSHASVIFGRKDGPRLLRGLGSSIRPRNVAYDTYDEVHWVMPGEAFYAARELYQTHGLFMGPTSGAAYLVGSWWAQANRESKTIILLPDEGYRYQDTVYDNDWLRAHHTQLGERAAGPTTVGHPSQAGNSWSKIDWARRTLDSVLGTQGH